MSPLEFNAILIAWIALPGFHKGGWRDVLGLQEHFWDVGITNIPSVRLD